VGTAKFYERVFSFLCWRGGFLRDMMWHLRSFVFSQLGLVERLIAESVENGSGKATVDITV
jgi:hypothetical protein